MGESMTLNIWSLIVQTIEAVAVVGALIYASLQIRESRNIARIETTREVFKELSEQNARESRAFLYRNRAKYTRLAKDGSNLDRLTKEQRFHATAVSYSFDSLGFPVEKGLVPIELLEGYMYVICRCWIILESFIVANRVLRDEPTFQSHFEKLAAQIFEKHLNREDMKII